MGPFYSTAFYNHIMVCGGEAKADRRVSSVVLAQRAPPPALQAHGLPHWGWPAGYLDTVSRGLQHANELACAPPPLPWPALTHAPNGSHFEAGPAGCRVDARVDDPGDGEDATDDGAEGGEKVRKGGALLAESDHDGRDVVDEEDACL